MPRESVEVQSRPGRTLDGKPVPPTASEVMVGWNKLAAAVQVGVGRESADGKEGSSTWTEDLDRAQINRLIRLLRKARDDAFGRDE